MKIHSHEGGKGWTTGINRRMNGHREIKSQEQQLRPKLTQSEEQPYIRPLRSQWPLAHHRTEGLTETQTQKLSQLQQPKTQELGSLHHNFGKISKCQVMSPLLHSNWMQKQLGWFVGSAAIDCGEWTEGALSHREQDRSCCLWCRQFRVFEQLSVTKKLSVSPIHTLLLHILEYIVFSLKSYFFIFSPLSHRKKFDLSISKSSQKYRQIKGDKASFLGCVAIFRL